MVAHGVGLLPNCGIVLYNSPRSPIIPALSRETVPLVTALLPKVMVHSHSSTLISEHVIKASEPYLKLCRFLYYTLLSIVLSDGSRRDHNTAE